VSQASPASVRADLLQNYSELFGTKTIDGRKVNVEECVQLGIILENIRTNGCG